MNIEVLLFANLKDVNDESVNNYEVNKNLFEVNNFEAKKGQMFFLADSENTDWSTLIVGTSGCESEYDFVNLGAKIGKKIGKDSDIKLVQKAKNLDIYSIEFGLLISTYSFDEFKSEKSSSIDFKVIDSDYSEEIQNKIQSIFWVRDMVNYPALTKSPEFFQEKVEDLVGDLDINLTIFDEKWILENNMGGVAGVAQGSERAPKFLVGEYNPNAEK